MEQSLKLNITAASTVGCVRNNNEDMLLVGHTFVRDDHYSTSVALNQHDRYLLALADGMGGHRSGDVASSTVLSNLCFFYSDIPAQLPPGNLNEAMCEWLASINHIIDANGREHPECQGMGTTLVALAWYDNHFYSLNCGDSRLYVMHNGQLHQLTTDHSMNTLTQESRHSNLLFNCIGGGCKTSYFDMVQCTGDIGPGDTVLLCSDGLSDMLSNDEIERLLVEDCHAEALCKAAEMAGGLDNISCIVARISTT